MTTQIVQPADLTAYLRSAGWVEARTVAGGAGAIWQRQDKGRTRQLLLPLDATYDDYADRLREALARIASVEQRPLSDLVADIVAASDATREMAIQEDVEILGLVVELSRPEPAAQGKVTIITSDEDPSRRISVELDGATYRLAGEAHFSHIPVACRGRLARAGSTYALHNPHDFRLERDQ